MYGLNNHTGGMEMTSNRQDAWSQDEDVLLAEVVLRHIREGGTQLQAFEEVGRKLSRTSAACGFRWNSFVRKQYKSGIELAKKQRKEGKKLASSVKELPDQSKGSVFPSEPEQSEEYNSVDVFSMGSMIQFLRKAEQAVQNEETFKVENVRLKEEIVQLQSKINSLEKEKEMSTKKLQLLEDDHQSLLAIFEKARKMALLQGNEDKVKFQMDKNGNLQRVKK
jgi:prespore-specific regulator